MTLENNIKDTIQKKLEDGTIEKLIAQELEKGVTNALQNLFCSYGDVTEIIEKKIKDVMVPYIEDYDYSQYITKLDSVLVDVLKSSALENKKLLENFKDLMIPDERKEIKATELFEIWMEYVKKNVSTDDLEVNYEDGVTYDYVEVEMEAEEDEARSWSSFEHANLIFECEHDEEMNFSIHLSRYNKSSDEGWDIRYDRTTDLRSLRYLNDFEVLLMKLDQNRTTIILDSHYEQDEIIPEAEPEPYFA